MPSRIGRSGLRILRSIEVGHLRFEYASFDDDLAVEKA